MNLQYNGSVIDIQFAAITRLDKIKKTELIFYYHSD